MIISKNILKILKSFLLVASYSYIAYKIYTLENIDSLVRPFAGATRNVWILLSAILLFMYFNWMLEAIKWKYIIKRYEQIQLKRAFLAVLAGVAVSIFTPNRIGEFGGRIFFVKPENRIRVIPLTIVAGYSQLLVTAFAGVFSLLALILMQNIFEKAWLLFTVSTVITTVSIWLYFKMNVLGNILDKIGVLKKFRDIINTVNTLTTKQLLNVVLLSLIRYIVFSIQFYFALRIFSVEIGVVNGFIAIAATFLLTTIIPTAGLIELGVRTSVAVLIIGAFSDNSAGIIAASVFLWFVNLVLPSLIGSYFLMKSKI